MNERNRRAETAAVRGAADFEKKNGPVTPPIYQTSTFEVTDNEEQIRVTTTDRYYTRWGNPTITLAEQTVKNNETVLVYETLKSHHDAEYVVRYSKFGCSTSEVGQSRRFWRTLATSAVHLTSDISVRSGFRKV